MPCYDAEGRAAEAQALKDVPALEAKVQKLTRIACTFATNFEELSEVVPVSLTGEHAQEALEWWAHHKEADRKRMDP